MRILVWIMCIFVILMKYLLMIVDVKFVWVKKMLEDKCCGEDVEDGGFGFVYMLFVIMEEILDKFRLFDYEW